MKKITLALTLLSFPLIGCAQTPEQSAAYRQLGMTILSAQSQANTQQTALSEPSVPVNTYCYRIGNQVQCSSQ